MKRNLIPALFLVAAFNAYALPIEGGKIIGHSEKIAPQAKLAFKQSQNNVVKKMLEQKFDSKLSDSYQEFSLAVTTLGEIKTGEGHGYEVVIQAGDHNGLYIANMTSEKKTYQVTHRVCVSMADVPEPMYCSSSVDVVELESQTTYNDAKIPVLEMHFPSPGKYAATIWTIVEKDNGTSAAESSDYREFIVPAK